MRFIQVGLKMGHNSMGEITFSRLTEVDASEIAAHMSDPLVAEHMPLLTTGWDAETAKGFVARKEEYWTRDGLGHGAFLLDGRYIGWGGFQREGGEWDYGLVLKPSCFGLGPRLSRMLLDFAVSDERIPYVTFLLPPSRKRLGALRRLGAKYVQQIEYDGAKFHKYRLETVEAEGPDL